MYTTKAGEQWDEIALKVYGDEKEAKRLFQSYKCCTDHYCQQWHNGVSLEELTAAI